jgi:hypothetical protein
MTDGFRRIEKRFEAFREKISQCHEANATMDDIEDAYSRLYRLRNRYEYERDKRALDPTELAPLRKVLEEDNFIKGMLFVRVIGEHVEKGGSVLSYPDGSTFRVTSESSGAVVFAEPHYVFFDADDQEQPGDHRKQLREAERRVARAFARARGSDD